MQPIDTGVVFAKIDSAAPMCSLDVAIQGPPPKAFTAGLAGDPTLFLKCRHVRSLFTDSRPAHTDQTARRDQFAMDYAQNTR